MANWKRDLLNPMQIRNISDMSGNSIGNFTGERDGIYEIIKEGTKEYLVHRTSEHSWYKHFKLPTKSLTEKQKLDWILSLYKRCPRNPITYRVIELNGPTAAMIRILFDRPTRVSNTRFNIQYTPIPIIPTESNIQLPMQQDPPTQEYLFTRTAADFYRPKHNITITL